MDSDKCITFILVFFILFIMKLELKMNLFNNNKICMIAVTSMVVMKILKKIRIIEMVQDSVTEVFLTIIFEFSIKFCTRSSIFMKMQRILREVSLLPAVYFYVLEDLSRQMTFYLKRFWSKLIFWPQEEKMELWW